MPTAHGWNFLRAAERNGSWDVRKLRTLDEAVPLLTAQDDFVLGLPIAAVLAQRFHLPTVDPAEFPEMVRIQIEKLFSRLPGQLKLPKAPICKCETVISICEFRV